MATKESFITRLLCWIGWHDWSGYVRSNFGFDFDYCIRCKKRRNEIREEA